MNPVVYRLDLDQLDDTHAEFVHPDRAVLVRMDRGEWIDAGRPAQLHVGITTDGDRAMQWLRLGD